MNINEFRKDEHVEVEKFRSGVMLGFLGLMQKLCLETFRNCSSIINDLNLQSIKYFKEQDKAFGKA